MDDKLKTLYNNLSGSYDLPDYETFALDMQDSVKSKKLYDNLVDSYDLPDYDTFVGDMGLKKKDQTFLPTPGNLQKDFQERPEDFSVVPSPSPSDKRDTSVGGDLLRTLKSTSLKALGGIAGLPELADRTIDRIFMYPIAKAMSPDATDEQIQIGLDTMSEGTFMGSQLEAVSNVGEGIQTKLNKVAQRTDARMKQIEGGIIENFKSGNVGEGFEQLARGVVGTIPYLAEVAATAGAGTPAVLSTIGATAASQQYGDIKGREDLSEGKKILNSWMYGGFEATGELVTAGILNRTFRAVRGAGKDVPKEVIDNMAKSIAKKFGLVAKEGTEEAGSEMATQIGQNLTAMATGEDPNRRLFDGVWDAGLIGFIPGAGFGSIQAAVGGRAVATQKEVDKVNESHEKQATIIEQIETSETPAAKEALEGELARLKDEEYAVIDKNIEIAQGLTDEAKIEAGKLQAARTELQSKLESGEIAEEEIPTIEESVKSIDKQIEEIRTAPESQVVVEPEAEVVPEPVAEAKAEEEAKAEPLKTKEEITAISDRMGEIEKIAGAEGYRFEIEQDADPDMTTVNVFTGTNQQIGVDELHEGIKELHDEYTELVHEWGISAELEEPTVAETAQIEAKAEEAPMVEETAQPETTEPKPKVSIGEKTPATKAERKVLGIKSETAFTTPIMQGETEIGKVTVEDTDEGWRIKWIDTDGARIKDPTTRGTGREAMRLINAEAQKVGKVVISDVVGKTSDQATKAWDKLVESGDAEKVGEGYRFIPQTTESIEPKVISQNLGINYIGETEGLENYSTEVNGETYNFTTKTGATEGEVAKLRDEIVRNATERPSNIEETIRKIEDAAKAESTEPKLPEPPIEEAKVEEKEPTRKYEIGRKVVEDSTLPDEVKSDLLERGIEYVPRGRKYTDAEANELVSLYEGVEGGLDKLASVVYNLSNDILPDTRTVLNVYIADRYSKQLNDATTTEDRLKIRTKLADAFVFGQEQAKIAGQWVESQKKWKDILARDPEAVIVIKRRAQSKDNDIALEPLKEDVKTAKQMLDELLNTDEFKQIIEQKVGEEINKIGTKKFGATDKKKIDDFFDSLLIKTDKAFDATVGIPIAVYNGAMLTIKKAVLTGVDLVNAIAQAVDYIDKWYKENYAKGTIPSPDWNKDDYSAQMREVLKPLTKKVKKIKFKIPKSAEQSIVDKIYAKMEVASKPQLRRLIQGYVAELEESGVVTEQKFKDIFARAIGLDVLSVEDEQVIRLAGQSINHARKKADRLMEKFSEYLQEAQSEKPDKAKLAQIEKDIEIAKAEAKKSRLSAQRAAKKLDDILAEESTLGQTVMKLVQAGLLTPISLVSNIVGNISFLPFRGQAAMAASALDALVYGLSKAYTPIIKRIDVTKNPRLARILKGLPEPKRVYNNFAYARGYGRGFVRGGIEGLRGLVEGQSPEDLQKREISKGLEPIKALLRFRDTLKGKEQLKFDRFFSDMLEMLPAGYMGEAMFRALNLGDKPFRRAAENARLYEIASLKGLSGKQREQFLMNPDAESMSEAKKAGDIAVYQEDSIISNWIRNLDTYLKRQGADDKGKEISIIVKAMVYLLRTTSAPYIKTPINLANEAIEYATPLYSLGRGIERVTKGDRRGALDYFGKTIVGLEILAIGSWLIREALLTSPPDDDEKVRQAQFEGRGAYRLNISALWRRLGGGTSEWKDGDRNWSIQRFGVLSMILMGIAKAYKDTPVKEMDELGMIQRNIAMMPSIMAGSLDQAFLSGTSTALQAILEGGPSMDTWLVSSSRALSAVVYPNVLGQVSQTFFDDNYIKEVKNMYDEEKALGQQIKNTFKDRMFMGKDLPNKISVWGEPVLRVPEGRNWPYMLFDTRKEVKYQKSSFGVKMWEFYDRYRFIDEDRAKVILPSPPSAKTDVGWDSRNMTSQEVEQLLMNVGRRRKSYVEYFMNSAEWEAMSEEERIDELQIIYREAASQVKAQMFMLDILQKGYPDAWKVIYDNGLIPVPTKTVKIKAGERIITLEGEDAAEYYDMVQRYFGEMADGNITWAKGAKLSEDELMSLTESLNSMWLGAKQMANGDYLAKD